MLRLKKQQLFSVEEGKGLKIPRYYTKNNNDSYSMFEFVKKSSIIKNPDGSVIFEMHNIEIPKFWSQVAIDVLAQKYLRKAGVPQTDSNCKYLLDKEGNKISGPETSLKQAVHRLAGCWRYWGEKYNYFAAPEDAQAFYDEIAFMLLNQYCAPNSPQWFNTGLNWAYEITGPAQGHSFVNPETEELEYSKDAYTRCQPHACFIQSIKDDLVNKGGIFDLVTREARIFKYGSGTGSNFSSLRGFSEKLSGGGVSSGMMSFLRINDVAAGAIKSGGTTRRAAKMVCVDLDHPDIEEFILWKVKEEQKVADLVIGSKILKKQLNNIIKKSVKSKTTDVNKSHELTDFSIMLFNCFFNILLPITKSATFCSSFTFHKINSSMSGWSKSTQTILAALLVRSEERRVGK